MYFLGDFGQALLIRSCHKDVVLKRKSHNCAGTAFVQGDSASGLELIEQTSPEAVQQLKLLPGVNTSHFLCPRVDVSLSVILMALK